MQKCSKSTDRPALYFPSSNGRLGLNRSVILEALVLSTAEPKWQVPAMVSLLS